MTDAKKIIIRVISLTVIAIALEIFLVSLALDNRDKNIYPSNFSVNGISIANLDREQAYDWLKQNIPPIKSNLSLQVKLPDETVSLPIEKCGICFDYKTTLDHLNSYLNQEKKAANWLDHVVIRGGELDQNMAYLFDKDLIYKQMIKVQEKYNKAAVDARIIYDDGTIKYIAQQNGYIIDIDATMQNISNSLQNGNLGPVPASVTILYPRVKIDDIRNVKDVLGVFAITLNSNQIRKGSDLNKLAAGLNGIIIMPDETFSLDKELDKINFSNSLNGISAAINTVYKAMLQANIKVEEKPYSKGNCGTLIIHNSLKNPVLISALIKGDKLLVRVFGCQTDKGKEIHLTTEESELPAQVNIRVDTRLKSGQRVVKQEGTNGTIIRTYRVVTDQGYQVEKTLLTEEISRGKDTIIMIGPNSPEK